MSQPSPSHIRATAVRVATLRRLALSVLFTIATTSYQTTCTVSERTFNKRQHANARYAVESHSSITHYDRYSYILLWSCPIHGHSYGFHIIDGAEGPKDVFCSLLKYKEDMPQELFYDNACHLSEYCLNREPALFEDTRFWHDLFHAIAHLCGINFKLTRVEGFGGINTEICEQVNSYLQAIKYMGTHLSQDHFVFFLQFFCTC